MKTLLHLFFAGAIISSLPSGSHAADTYYWDANGDSDGTGGTGNWNLTSLWRDGSDAGTLMAWTSNKQAILAGNAGTLDLNSSSVTAAALTVQTAGYEIKSTAATRTLTVTGALGLADAASLKLTMPSATWKFGSISMGAGAVLTISGSTSGASNAHRIDLTTASTTSSGGSVTINGTGTASSGFVGTAVGVQLNSNILNNSTAATMLGATSGSSFTYGGIISGSAHLQISAGASEGAGTVILSNTNTYAGSTYINNAATGVLRLGVENALPIGTTLLFGQSAHGGAAAAGGSLELNGFSQTVQGLSGGGNGVSNAGVLSTLTLSSTVANSYSGVISGNIALVKEGVGSQTLSAASSYSGGTSVTGGTLIVSNTTGSGLGTGPLTVSNPGSTLSGSGTIRVPTTIGQDAIHSPGNSPGTQTFTNTLQYSSNSIFSWDVSTAGGVRGAPDGYDGVNVDAAKLSGTGAVFRIVLQESGEDFTTSFWKTPRSWADIFMTVDETASHANWASIFSGGFEYANPDGGLSAPSYGSFRLSGGTLAWSPAPEPANALAALILAAGLFRRQRSGQRSGSACGADGGSPSRKERACGGLEAEVSIGSGMPCDDGMDAGG
jgi:autotransporter-associated beta strand protein